jgi:hypothetical protein
MSSAPTPDARPSYRDGRDEMNLADFPISVLQRQQPGDGAGHKLDRLEFEASRYDPVKRQRVRQKVTLTSTAGDGLPTPADEHVILALLYVAKHDNDFADATVRFAPGRLFDIMGWAPNGRSYTRLRDVLRRLKSLTIRYENAWWDAAGRGYEEEVATGIVSAYRIAQQVSGPRKPNAVGASWVTWTQQFHDSLRNGNIKRLNLEVFFKLSSPTAQRLYRFLDKRFYNTPELALDLTELACGHVGLTESHNVAILKRRLAPAIAELETIGFLAPMDQAERYQKVRPGVWRVHFRAGGNEPFVGQVSNLSGTRDRLETCPTKALASRSPEAELAVEFYRLWGRSLARPGVRDREQAAALLATNGPETARGLLPALVQVTKKEWPECRSFSGAVQKYLADALKVFEATRQRDAARLEQERRLREERERTTDRQRQEDELAGRWAALPAAEQERVRRAVLARLPGGAPEAFVRRLCLEELRRRSEPEA